MEKQMYQNLFLLLFSVGHFLLLLNNRGSLLTTTPSWERGNEVALEKEI